ncbi:MAG: hypothetical protein ACYC6T_05755 [Thermoleophilia bacterium]
MLSTPTSPTSTPHALDLAVVGGTLVIFDPDRVEDRAGYPGLGAPDAPPVGIHHVIVNGVSVVSAGEFQSTARSGRPIRRENRPWIM